MTGPPLRDGSPGGLRFVWDGRSVNRVINADSLLIPRVEDLIERITRLKHEAHTKGITEMWISTLHLRTSCWEVTLDEVSHPLTSFSTTVGTCVCVFARMHMQCLTPPQHTL